MALAQEYTLFRTLDNFKDAINCLQFSADGRWLAAGGDEGRLAIFDFQSDDMGCKDVDIVDRVTVVSLLWHPSKHGALFAGYGHGIIMLYHVGATRQSEPFPVGYPIEVDISGPVEALEFDQTTDTLAAVVGKEVVLHQPMSDVSHKSRKLLPTADQSGQIPEVTPCSLHFLDEGEALLVAYVNHAMICWDPVTMARLWELTADGCIARSVISPDLTSVVVYNVEDGVFDRYAIDGPRRKLQTYSVHPGENVRLPAAFIHHGEAVLLGSCHGAASIVNAHDGSLVQSLTHPDAKMIQAIAYMKNDSDHFIATGSSDVGQRTSIVLWKRNLASSPQVDEPRSADNAERTAPRASQVHHKARENLRQQREMHSPLSILAWRITIVVCLGAVMVTFMMSDSVGLCLKRHYGILRQRRAASGDSMVKTGSSIIARKLLRISVRLLESLRRVLDSLDSGL